MTDTIRISVVVKGRVQGVFFRAYTQEAAQKAGVTGYVKNLPDGSVQADFQGQPHQVESMVDWCKKGSPMSSVTDVVSTRHKDLAEYADFKITY